MDYLTDWAILPGYGRVERIYMADDARWVGFVSTEAGPDQGPARVWRGHMSAMLNEPAASREEAIAAVVQYARDNPDHVAQ